MLVRASERSARGYEREQQEERGDKWDRCELQDEHALAGIFSELSRTFIITKEVTIIPLGTSSGGFRMIKFPPCNLLPWSSKQPDILDKLKSCTGTGLWKLWHAKQRRKTLNITTTLGMAPDVHPNWGYRALRAKREENTEHLQPDFEPLASLSLHLWRG